MKWLWNKIVAWWKGPSFTVIIDQTKGEGSTPYTKQYTGVKKILKCTYTDLVFILDTKKRVEVKCKQGLYYRIEEE